MGLGLGTCNLCGKTWTVKSLLRFGLYIILVNVIVATLYFIRGFSMGNTQIFRQNSYATNVRKHHAKTLPLTQDVADVLARNRISDFKIVDIKHGTTRKTGKNNPTLEEENNSDILISDQDGEIDLDLDHDANILATEIIEPEVPYDVADDSGEEEKGSRVNTGSMESEHLDDIFSFFSDVADRTHHKSQPTFSNTRLQNKSHPQYSMAFPGHNKPLHLLNWTQSADTRRYFQPIDDYESWVYSAYYDGREAEPLVIVLGISQRKFNGRVYCKYLREDGRFIKQKKGRLGILKDGHGASIVGTKTWCLIKPNLRPAFVQISFSSSQRQPTNKIKIQYPVQRSRNFTVCFPPFHSNYSNTNQLVQTLELNRVMGADHFYVYNFSMTDSISHILNGYQSLGIVSVLQWPLPNLDSWYYGQVLAINDCIYRNMGISRYVVISDTDEVIVPHIHRSWLSLLENVNKHDWLRNDEFHDPLDQVDSKKKKNKLELKQVDDGQIEQGTAIDKRLQRRSTSLRHKRVTEGQYQDNNKGEPLKFAGSYEHVQSSRSNRSFPIPSAKSSSLYDNPNEFNSEEEVIPKNDHIQFSSFSFRCAFYTIRPLYRSHMKEFESFNFSHEERDLFSRLPHCPMMSVMRTDEIYEHGIRSKVIVKPELIMSSAIHKVVIHRGTYKTAYIDKDIALVHHFRNYKLHTCNTLDLSVLNFKDKFFQNLQYAVKSFSSLLFS